MSPVKNRWIVCLLILLIVPGATLAADGPSKECPDPVIASTTPKMVDIDALLKALAKVRSAEGKPVYTIDDALRAKLTETFRQNRTSSKLQQFYSMLYTLQEHSVLPRGVMHQINGSQLGKVLIVAGVFPDDSFPKLIDRVQFRRSSLTPYYIVSFSKPSARFPLNGGEGFRGWQNGMCQQAKALLFRTPLSFAMKILGNGNLYVYKFKNVDIEGVFGTRGIVDIDLNYVSLLSTEFLKDSVLGKVTARVADREFEVNDHSWILRMITNFFSDTTTQAIDW